MKEILLRVEKVANQFNESIMNPATDKQIETFKKWAAENGIEAKEYIDFVKIVNGMDFDGLVVYSINDLDNINIYKLNSEWHEVEDNLQYIFFADSDMTWYCFDKKGNMFCELSKPSATLLKTYTNFSEMILPALELLL